jgi:hypothetical protein
LIYLPVKPLQTRLSRKRKFLRRRTARFKGFSSY